jgi:hypothetical protein
LIINNFRYPNRVTVYKNVHLLCTLAYNNLYF